MQNTELHTAPISAFKTLRAPILFGQALNDVKILERSILEFGLISPIIVSIAKDTLVVIDGKKRLAAIKRLAFAGQLPRSLVNIPYILTDQAKQMDFRAVSVLSGRDLYQAVMDLKAEGTEIEEIAARLYLDRRSIIETLSLSRLSPRLRQAFFAQTICFQQALAFTALPDMTAQDTLLLRLGPFAKPHVILETIKSDRDAALVQESRQKPELFEGNIYVFPTLENSYTNYAQDSAALKSGVTAPAGNVAA